jgi:hypothetical protein
MIPLAAGLGSGGRDHSSAPAVQAGFEGGAVEAVKVV